MPTVTATESTPFIPEGIYMGTVATIEEAPSMKADWADQFKFVFTLDGKFYEKGDKAGQPMDMWHYVSQKLTPKSNLWQTAIALGVMPILGQPLNTDDLLDRKAQLVVKHIDTGTGPKAKIVDMLKAGASAPPAAAGEPCVVCKLKGKTVALDHYGGNGEPLCAAHDDSDLPQDLPID